MGTTLATLSPPKGARHKRKRLGRGPASGRGTTAGRGQKGQKSRTGASIRPGFEGGQMPLQRRLPKRGFINPFRVEYAPLNVCDLAKLFEAGETVEPAAMKSKGMIPRKAKLVKVLGRGEISHALVVKAHAFSKSAEEKIKAAGGKVEVLPAKPGTKYIRPKTPKKK